MPVLLLMGHSGLALECPRCLQAEQVMATAPWCRFIAWTSCALKCSPMFGSRRLCEMNAGSAPGPERG